MKKRFAIVLALLMALSLAACGDQNDDPNDVVGDDWRVTGVVRDSGSITRDGGDIDVLVCVNADSADFCYDDETYAIYDYVDYPITLQGDPWSAGADGVVLGCGSRGICVPAGGVLRGGLRWGERVPRGI